MFSFLFKKKKENTQHTYRIVEYPEIGFVPELYRGLLLNWQPLEPSGFGTTVIEIVFAYPDKYAYETEKEAGEVINKHSRMRDSEVIWSG